MDGKKSKFDYLSFTDGFFAVNKDKYTKEEAVQLFLEETCGIVHEIITGTVYFGFGVDEDGEKHNCWWLDIDYTGSSARRFPVWVIR